MKDVNDLMQAILEMDAAQRRESEKARLERSARLAALDEQKQKIIAECDAREKSESAAAARAAEEGNAAALAALLNRNLTFVAPVDLSNRLLAELCSQIDPEMVPVISAAAAILQDSAQPHVFLGGEQYLLNWPQLEGKVGDILTLLNDEEQAAHIIAPPADRSESVLLGEDLEPQIPGLCIVSDRYLVGGGLWGTVALIGPTRMPFQKLMPLLHLFADELGEGMSGKRKDTPQMAAPRRTVIYKEDLE